MRGRKLFLRSHIGQINGLPGERHCFKLKWFSRWHILRPFSFIIRCHRSLRYTAIVISRPSVALDTQLRAQRAALKEPLAAKRSSLSLRPCAPFVVRVVADLCFARRGRSYGAHCIASSHLSRKSRYKCRMDALSERLPTDGASCANVIETPLDVFNQSSDYMNRFLKSRAGDPSLANFIKRGDHFLNTPIKAARRWTRRSSRSRR